jgi:hypothetical protein
MLDPIIKLGLNHEFYHIDKAFRPVFNYSKIKIDEAFVYNNYFGICDIQVAELAGKCKNLIIDNSQAFFAKPIQGVDSFYSPRKFFGVPDGAYLYTDKLLPVKFETDNSIDRLMHLIGRIENEAEESYHIFRENDQKLSGQPIKQMSNITQRLLQSIDYEHAAKIRKKNFEFLHEKLSVMNSLNLEISNYSVPMVYPFLTDNENLRNHLIRNKIFVARYWPNVIDWVNKDSVEHNLTLNNIPLPIDQRYSLNDMSLITKLII